jgi:two-component system response regulator HydG
VPALRMAIPGERDIWYPIHLGRTVIGRGLASDIHVPDPSVSRRHCIVERTGDRVVLIDASQHGTRVDGARIERCELRDGALVEVGDVALRFVERVEAPPSTTGVVRPRTHEEIVAVTGEGVASARAALRVSRGPHTGRVILLERPVVTVGGTRDDDVVLAGLPSRALRLQVARGRVVVEPVVGARVTLAGGPVQVATPAWLGEEIVVGGHGLVVEQQVEHDASDADQFGDLVGASPPMRRVFGMLRRIAAHDHPVLLTGESGTGKELAARALHGHGQRGSGPFVPINCAALPEALVESVLFGHEKGAFTGATARQDGAFQAAHGGTLFLDEVGELRLETQAKLLRALESGEVVRVGSMVAETPDVRLVAATNRDLPAMVRQGTFRSDLYFRLSVLQVPLPPLRVREGDVPLLARSLLARLLPDARLEPSAVAALAAHDWPGNVRELRNVLIRARVLHGPVITGQAIHLDETYEVPPLVSDEVDDGTRAAILEALERSEGNRSRAAQLLGIPRSSLLYRMKRYHIS